jgi:hypothetical protein
MYDILAATILEAFGTLGLLVILCAYTIHLFALFGQE